MSNQSILSPHLLDTTYVLAVTRRGPCAPVVEMVVDRYRQLQILVTDMLRYCAICLFRGSYEITTTEI